MKRKIKLAVMSSLIAVSSLSASWDIGGVVFAEKPIQNKYLSVSNGGQIPDDQVLKDGVGVKVVAFEEELKPNVKDMNEALSKLKEGETVPNTLKDKLIKMDYGNISSLPITPSEGAIIMGAYVTYDYIDKTMKIKSATTTNYGFASYLFPINEGKIYDINIKAKVLGNKAAMYGLAIQTKPTRIGNFHGGGSGNGNKPKNNVFYPCYFQSSNYTTDLIIDMVNYKVKDKETGEPVCEFDYLKETNPGEQLYIGWYDASSYGRNEFSIKNN